MRLTDLIFLADTIALSKWKRSWSGLELIGNRFVWIARGLSLSRRIRHLEERWAYYFAFGEFGCVARYPVLTTAL